MTGLRICCAVMRCTYFLKPSLLQSWPFHVLNNKHSTLSTVHLLACGHLILAPSAACKTPERSIPIQPQTNPGSACRWWVNPFPCKIKGTKQTTNKRVKIIRQRSINEAEDWKHHTWQTGCADKQREESSALRQCFVGSYSIAILLCVPAQSAQHRLCAWHHEEKNFLPALTPVGPFSGAPPYINGVSTHAVHTTNVFIRRSGTAA